MYFSVDYKPEVSEDDFIYLRDFLIGFFTDPTNTEKLDLLFQERYNNLYRTETSDARRDYVYGWFKDRGIKIGKFDHCSPADLGDQRAFDIINSIFPNKWVSVQSLSNGNYLVPHIDLGNRHRIVKNFPIYNCETSESIFFKLKTEFKEGDFAAFTFDDLEEDGRFMYTPRHVHSFNATIPHSVYSTHTGPRIMLSCYS